VWAPIAIGVSSKVFLEFIEYTQHPNIARRMGTLAEHLDLYKLLCMYDCPNALRVVGGILTARITADPWEMFILASERNDVPFARTALKHFKPDTFGDGTFWAKMARVRPEWQLHLLACIFHHPQEARKSHAALCPQTRLAVPVFPPMTPTAPAQVKCSCRFIEWMGDSDFPRIARSFNPVQPAP
jgi:hypothetical protein